jgi:hypothetical protein
MPRRQSKGSRTKSRTKRTSAPMTDRQAMSQARGARKRGKATTTQAGSFVHEEMEHMKKGTHGSRRPIKNRKQAIAIGLSKARKHGIAVGQKRSRAKSR